MSSHAQESVTRSGKRIRRAAKRDDAYFVAGKKGLRPESEKRIRRAAKRDDAYFAAVQAEEADAGTYGGLRAGSGYHYDRAYDY